MAVVPVPGALGIAPLDGPLVVVGAVVPDGVNSGVEACSARR